MMQKKKEGDKYLLLKLLFVVDIAVIVYIIFFRKHSDPHLIE